MFLGKESTLPPFFCVLQGKFGRKQEKIHQQEGNRIATYRFFQFYSVVFSNAHHFVVLDSWHAKILKKKVNICLSVLLGQIKLK